jgi:F420-non-reducing hydrogenase small subunit
VVDVDYYIPGCPPTPRLLRQAVSALLAGTLPPRGAVLAPDLALCSECPRRETKPDDLSFVEFKRPHLTEIDPSRCFLMLGIPCMGPATRAGCEGLCIAGNMPCTGCFGPLPRVKEQGAKILAALASSVSAEDERDVDAILAGLPDPVGTFYRYGLPRSLLRARHQDGRGPRGPVNGEVAP